MKAPTPDALRMWADIDVLEDYRCHKENGVDLNPFSTAGNRSTWQRGYDGKPWEVLDGDVRYNKTYQRGAAARRLVEKKAKETS